MSEKHIGEVVQVIGPVLDIRFVRPSVLGRFSALPTPHSSGMNSGS